MNRTKYGYAESSNLRSTIAGHNYHIVHDTLPIENGTLWKLGDMKNDEDVEIYSATKPAKGDKVILALAPLVPVDTSTTLGQHEMFLRTEAGIPVRAYELEPTDRYAIADYMIKAIAGESNKGPVVKGNIIVANLADDVATYEEKPSGEDLAAYGFAAKIEKIINKGTLTTVLIRVLKNETVTA